MLPRSAAPSTPVVMAFAGEDPVEAGLVASLARPGGNVTGIALLAAEMDAKRVELLAQAVPNGSASFCFTRYASRIDLVSRSVQPTLSVLNLSLFEPGTRRTIVRHSRPLRALRQRGLSLLLARFFRDGAELAALAATLGLPTICGVARNGRTGLSTLVRSPGHNSV